MDRRTDGLSQGRSFLVLSGVPRFFSREKNRETHLPPNFSKLFGVFKSRGGWAAGQGSGAGVQRDAAGDDAVLLERECLEGDGGGDRGEGQALRIHLPVHRETRLSDGRQSQVPTAPAERQRERVGHGKARDESVPHGRRGEADKAGGGWEGGTPVSAEPGGAARCIHLRARRKGENTLLAPPPPPPQPWSLGDTTRQSPAPISHHRTIESSNYADHPILLPSPSCKRRNRTNRISGCSCCTS